MEEKENKFASLKDSFVKGGKGSKIDEIGVEKIGEILVQEFKNKGKKFGIKEVAEIIKTRKIADYSNCANESAALKNAASKVMKALLG